MRWHRWEARVSLEDGMAERRVDGSPLQLVTVCLSDDGAGEVSDEQGRPLAPAPPVFRICARAKHVRSRSSSWSSQSWPTVVRRGGNE
jgi:hypothetical protein